VNLGDPEVGKHPARGGIHSFVMLATVQSSLILAAAARISDPDNPFFDPENYGILAREGGQGRRL
jgi:hypothetical protein